MYVWPYNGEIENELATSNPVAQKVFNEIWDGAQFPANTLHGNAIMTVGYIADGEANDYILKEFDIPSVSPELANDNFFSNQFFLEYDFVVRDVLRDNYPWIKYTFRKLSGEIKIEDNAIFEDLGNGKIKMQFTYTNIGLQERSIPASHFKIYENPNISFQMNGDATLQPRDQRTITFEVDADFVNYNVRKEISYHMVYSRFATDVSSTVNEIRFKNVKA